MLPDEHQDITRAAEGQVSSGVLVLPFPVWLILGAIFIGMAKHISVFPCTLTNSSNVYKKNQMKINVILYPSSSFVSTLVYYLMNQIKGSQ